jgi:hypothetical protein
LFGLYSQLEAGKACRGAPLETSSLMVARTDFELQPHLSARFVIVRLWLENIGAVRPDTEDRITSLVQPDCGGHDFGW